MPVDHYENFPVASILLPAHLRGAVETIYAFARSADDLADEGDACPEDRLASLSAYETELDAIARGASPETPLFIDLSRVIAEFNLPISAFYDLISAFKQDVSTLRYARYEDLLDYCRRSADPVGRLMLHLYGAANDMNRKQSDAICSALQLINFWQDVALDWNKDRIYIPQEDLSIFQVNERHIAHQLADQDWQALMRFEVDRARALMLYGAPLALRLPGRIGWELRLVVQGGLRILEKIESVQYDVFQRRPKLEKSDWIRVAWRALRMKAVT
ncbi:MAG: squalene synthase HpnC [Burkholderiaceae bacterium]